MRDMPLGLLIVAIIMTAAVGASLAKSEEANCVIDPVPYEKLLVDTLESMISHNWVRAEYYIGIASEAQICVRGLEAQHRELYDMLRRLNDLLRRVDEIESAFSSGETEGLKEQVRDVYNELDYLRQSIYERVIEYYRSLSGLAQDKTSFFEFRIRTDRALSALKGVIGYSMERLSTIYALLSEAEFGAWIEVSASLPGRIYAGDEVDITINLSVRGATEEVNVNEARIKVSLVIGYLLEVSKEVVTRVGENATVAIQVPDALAITDKGIDLINVRGHVYAALSRIVVTAESVDGEVKGLAAYPTYVYVMWPPLRFDVPSYAELNSTIGVRVVSHALTPVNVSIYLDEVANESLLMNTTVLPGAAWINITLVNASIGYHTIIFVNEPIGRYIRGHWSAAIVIGSPTVPLIMSIPRVVLVPPFIVEVRGEIGGDEGPYDVMIYVDNVLTHESNVLGGSFSAVLDLPIGVSTLLIGRVVVRVEVVPHTPGMSPSEYVVDVVVVNVFSILMVTGFTGALYLHPKTSAVFSYLLRVALVRKKKRGGKVGLIMKGVAFRPFRLRRYYDVLISLLSRISDPPAPSETFREYLRRIGHSLAPRIVPIVGRLFSLFEMDLYSVHEVNPREAEELLGDVEREVEGSDRN